MQTRIVVAVTLTAALTGSPAHAEEWLSVSKTSDDHPTEIFIDISSIVLKDNIRIAQTKWVALLPWPGHAQPFNGAAFGFQRWSFDCTAGLVQTGGAELHSADGRIAGFLDGEQRWRPVEDPVTKKMFDLVCRKPASSS